MSTDTKFCRYSCSRAGKQCCWVCHRHPTNFTPDPKQTDPNKNKPCKFACTLKCATLIQYENKYASFKKPPRQIVPMNRPCTIHYAAINTKRPLLSNGVDGKYRDIQGTAIYKSNGPGPRNILIDTPEGTVVVPFGNVKWAN